MSWTREITIWCDGERIEGIDQTKWPYCLYHHQQTGTLALARADLKSQGWVRINGLDLCPICAKKRAHQGVSTEGEHE